jgi:hypothetical protein
LLRAIDTTLWSTATTQPIRPYTDFDLPQPSASAAPTGTGAPSALNDYEMPIVSHQQGLLILRHFAYWALGEYVRHWFPSLSLSLAHSS